MKVLLSHPRRRPSCRHTSKKINGKVIVSVCPKCVPNVTAKASVYTSQATSDLRHLALDGVVIDELA